MGFEHWLTLPYHWRHRANGIYPKNHGMVPSANEPVVAFVEYRLYNLETKSR